MTIFKLKLLKIIIKYLEVSFLRGEFSDFVWLKEVKKCESKSFTTWAMLIKMIFEVDPLVCPDCGGEMKIISIIDRHQKDVVRDILECVGLWHESSPPPLVPLVSQLKNAEREFEEEVVLDEHYFDNLCG